MGQEALRYARLAALREVLEMVALLVVSSVGARDTQRDITRIIYAMIAKEEGKR